jgi:hypothetical protein
MFDYHKDFYGALPLHATITRYDFTTGDLPVRFLKQREKYA